MRPDVTGESDLGIIRYVWKERTDDKPSFEGLIYLEYFKGSVQNCFTCFKENVFVSDFH